MLDKMHVLVRGCLMEMGNKNSDFRAESEARHARADDRVPHRRIRRLPQQGVARDGQGAHLQRVSMCVLVPLYDLCPLNLYPLVLVGDDNPPFEGVFEFCSISAGGSIGTYFVLRFFPFIPPGTRGKGQYCEDKKPRNFTVIRFLVEVIFWTRKEVGRRLCLARSALCTPLPVVVSALKGVINRIRKK